MRKSFIAGTLSACILLTGVAPAQAMNQPRPNVAIMQTAPTPTIEQGQSVFVEVDSNPQVEPQQRINLIIQVLKRLGGIWNTVVSKVKQGWHAFNYYYNTYLKKTLERLGYYFSAWEIYSAVRDSIGW